MNKSLLKLVLSAAAFTVASSASAALERVDELTATALGLDANTQRGATLYAEQCAGCHGPQAHGAAEHDIPALAGQRRAYIVRQLAQFIERDRIATQMHKVVSREAVREPQSWADLALYLNNLPPPKHSDTGDGKHLSLGEASTGISC